jgi:hypothetical protein
VRRGRGVEELVASIGETSWILGESENQEGPMRSAAGCALWLGARFAGRGAHRIGLNEAAGWMPRSWGFNRRQ